MLVKSRDEVKVVPILLIGALERASASTFSLSMMCQMSVVNSEMNNSCLLWCGLHESCDPKIAMVGTLYIVM